MHRRLSLRHPALSPNAKTQPKYSFKRQIILRDAGLHASCTPVQWLKIMSPSNFWPRRVACF
jgi:hypothetical protein